MISYNISWVRLDIKPRFLVLQYLTQNPRRRKREKQLEMLGKLLNVNLLSVSPHLITEMFIRMQINKGRGDDYHGVPFYMTFDI